MLLSKSFRPLPDQQDMLALFHDLSGKGDRVPDTMHRRDGTAPERFSIHDARIELNLAQGIEVRAVPGVERRTVFKVADDLLDRIDRGSSALEQLPAQSKGAFAPGPVRFDQRVGNIPGATVNDQRDVIHKEEYKEKTDKWGNEGTNAG